MTKPSSFFLVFLIGLGGCGGGDNCGDDDGGWGNGGDGETPAGYEAGDGDANIATSVLIGV